MPRLRTIRPLVWILLGLAATLAAFSGKPLHMDDPLFVWMAQHIQSHPVDFFGFQVNWGTTVAPMPEVMQNPPANAYYLAIVGRLFGWGEIPLHLAFILPALGAALGIYQLAGAWCKRPVLATLLATATPMFLVSATTLMCDIPMLMFWVWAVVLWEKGLEGKSWLLLVAGVSAGLAILTKYNSIILLPLLALATVLRRRAWGWSAAALLLPILMLLAYERGTAALYGKGLFAMSSAYAATKRTGLAAADPYHYGSMAVACFSFLGGGIASATFSSIPLWPRRTLLAGGGTALMLMLGACALLPSATTAPAAGGGRAGWLPLLQAAFWAAGGLSTIALSAVAWWRRRDRVNTLLLAWIAGGVVYSIFINWMLSGRSLLWVLPAVAILVARQFEQVKQDSASRWKQGAPLAISALLALAVTRADYCLANSARQAATQITARYRPADGRPFWFQGHWGFQYYMQRLGCQAVDLAHPETKKGDWVTTPYNNVTVALLPADFASETLVLRYRPCTWLTTMHSDVAAGFYTSQFGLLPFSFCPVPPEVYYVQHLARPLPPVTQ